MPELKTIKVTEETIRNLNQIAGFTGSTQYEAAEESSRQLWEKIRKKIVGKTQKEIKTRNT